MLIFVKVSAAELAQAAEPSKKLNTEGVSLTAESTALPRAHKPFGLSRQALRLVTKSQQTSKITILSLRKYYGA